MHLKVVKFERNLVEFHLTSRLMNTVSTHEPNDLSSSRGTWCTVTCNSIFNFNVDQCIMNALELFGKDIISKTRADTFRGLKIKEGLSCGGDARSSCSFASLPAG